MVTLLTLFGLKCEGLYRSKEGLVSDYTIKDKVAIVGIGETQYYKAGQAPVSEFQIAAVWAVFP